MIKRTKLVVSVLISKNLKSGKIKNVEILCRDVQGVILSFLPIKDLLNACLVSKSFYKLAWKFSEVKDVIKIVITDDMTAPSYFGSLKNLQVIEMRDLKLQNEKEVNEQLSDFFSQNEYKKIEEYKYTYANSLPHHLGKLKELKKITISGFKGKLLGIDMTHLINLTDFMLYGSNVISIPPGIGCCKKLKMFCPYTSYGLHYLPYEILACPIKDFTMSRRAIWGCKRISPKPPKDLSKIVTERREFCSCCKKKLGDVRIRKLSQAKIGSDKVALLVVACSEECTKKVTSLTLNTSRW